MHRNEAALGITDEDAVYHPEYDLWLRPETLDEYIAKEARGYLRHMQPQPGEVLLDLGANIGCVAKAFLKAGCSKVICVEPEPENIRMLHKNLDKYASQIEVYTAAAVDYESSNTVSLGINQYANRGSHSVVTGHSRRPTIEVATVPVAYLMDRYSPDLIKCDIEGGELDFAGAFAEIPPSVRAVMIEMHFRGKDSHQRVDALHESLVYSGFSHTFGALGTEKTRQSLRLYERLL